MDVAWLGEPAAHEPNRVGGKAASLSRLAAEYSAAHSIPAVVDTKCATTVLRDGQLVEVDGTSGSGWIVEA